MATLSISPATAAVLCVGSTAKQHNKTRCASPQDSQKKEWPFRALADPSRTIAPLAIIGGTVAVYSSALNNHQSSQRQFAPISIVYLLLLALNYAIMPRLSKRFIHPQVDKRSVALTEEIVKMGMGIGGWIITHWASVCTTLDDDDQSACRVDGGANFITSTQMTYDALSDQLSHWSLQSMIVAAGVPSLLYAIQGSLTYQAYHHLDSVTFNGLMQFKVITSALGCYIVMRKTLSTIQLGTLGLLMVSTFVFQGSWKELLDRLCITKQRKEAAVTAGKLNHFWKGVLPCLGATLLSGLAGAFSQKSLQTAVIGSMMHRDAYFYTIEISFLSAICLIASLSFQQRKETPANTILYNSFFKHWNCKTLLPIVTKASAGVLTALVHCHLGSVIKGFALVLGLVFSALLQFVLEGDDLTLEQLVGTALVLLSSWLHFTNPSKQ
ncbi:hypothetical protein ACHAXN_006371 [Cyclotella atomus]